MVEGVLSGGGCGAGSNEGLEDQAGELNGNIYEEIDKPCMIPTNGNNHCHNGTTSIMRRENGKNEDKNRRLTRPKEDKASRIPERARCY